MRFAPKDAEGKPSITVEDFRRNNVDLTVKGIHDVIQATRPEVAFTVSPAADPAYNYDRMYADDAEMVARGLDRSHHPAVVFPYGKCTNQLQSSSALVVTVQPLTMRSLWVMALISLVQFRRQPIKVPQS